MIGGWQSLKHVAKKDMYGSQKNGFQEVKRYITVMIAVIISLHNETKHLSQTLRTLAIS